MTEILAEQLETEESMFVQTAQGIERDGDTLTLRGSHPRKKAICWPFVKPSDGLEPSTPSLPWRS
jgi:hypothetical protein